VKIRYVIAEITEAGDGWRLKLVPGQEERPDIALVRDLGFPWKPQVWGSIEVSGLTHDAVIALTQGKGIYDTPDIEVTFEAKVPAEV